MDRPDVTVRGAADADITAALGVLDAAALSTGVDRVRRSVDRDETLVAVRPTDGPDSGTVLGVIVLDGVEILAVAVRPRLRGQGIGSALVRAAAGRRERLVAQFRADVAPFYDSLGFDVEPLPADSDRYRGTLEPAGDGLDGP